MLDPRLRSSGDRASASGAEGHRFDSCRGRCKQEEVHYLNTVHVCHYVCHSHNNNNAPPDYSSGAYFFIYTQLLFYFLMDHTLLSDVPNSIPDSGGVEIDLINNVWG